MSVTWVDIEHIGDGFSLGYYFNWSSTSADFYLSYQS